MTRLFEAQVVGCDCRLQAMFFKEIRDLLRETVLDNDGKRGEASVESSCGLLPGQVECLRDERVAVAEADRSTDRFLNHLHIRLLKMFCHFLRS